MLRCNLTINSTVTRAFQGCMGRGGVQPPWSARLPNCFLAALQELRNWRPLAIVGRYDRHTHGGREKWLHGCGYWRRHATRPWPCHAAPLPCGVSTGAVQACVLAGPPATIAPITCHGQCSRAQSTRRPPLLGGATQQMIADTPPTRTWRGWCA
jgi:hypothetical protein